MILDDIKKISLRFGSLLENETAARSRPKAAMEVLKDHVEAISKARNAKISHERIAAFLTEAGIKTSSQTVRLFCKSELGETVLKKKRTRKRKPSVKAKEAEKIPIKTETNSRPSQITATKTQSGKSSKAGFRAAVDDDL